MAENSKIEWTDHTFNPWWGCVKVSPACAHCYAETFDKRVGGSHWGPESPRRFFGTAHWSTPIKWNTLAAKEGIRKRVFCASMADVFEEPKDPRSDDAILMRAERAKLFHIIKGTPNLDWLLLTKRPENIARMLPEDWGNGYPNVWLGTTVENQEYANKRIPELLKVPAVVRFLSCEPLLGPVDLDCWPETGCPRGWLDEEPGIDWVICGGESGHGARPMHPEWVDSLQKQCEAAGTAFFFKQWGEWQPLGQGNFGGWEQKPCFIPADLRTSRRDCYIEGNDAYLGTIGKDDFTFARKVGKNAAGRLLHGRTWNEFPEVTR